MKLWLSLALLGLLFLPACNSQPSTGEGSTQATETAQAGSNATEVKGFVTPEPLPNPVVTAEWSKFREASTGKFDALFSNFPNAARQALGADCDIGRIMVANQNLGYVGITLNDIQSTTLDSYYGALITLDSLRAVGLDEKKLPELFDFLNSIVKTAEPIVKPPADLDSDIAVVGNHIKRHLFALGEFYAHHEDTPTPKILAFNKSAIHLLDLIQKFSSYADILAAAEQTLDDTETAIAEESMDISPLRCVARSLQHLITRLRQETTTASRDVPATQANKAETSAAQTNKAETSAAPAEQQPKATATQSASTPAVATPGSPKSVAADNGEPQYPLNKPVTTKSGLQITILRNGHGANCKSGQMVSVHYQGTFTNGQIFDSSYTRKMPIEFPLGKGYVIDGWEEGVQGMQVGEKRHLVLTPDLGYGAQGSGPIPANATLIFDVELLKIE